MKVLKSLIIFILLIAGTSLFSGSSEECLIKWKAFRGEQGGRLIHWLEKEARIIIGGSQRPAVFRGTVPEYYGRVGIFITVLKDGKVRGCFGAFHHRGHRFSTTARRYLKGALRSDPRYRPLGIDELDECDIIVTIASPPAALEGIETIDLERYGILYRYSDGSLGVIVPAEVRTVEYLKKTAERKEVLSRFCFRAVTIRK